MGSIIALTVPLSVFIPGIVGVTRSNCSKIGVDACLTTSEMYVTEQSDRDDEIGSNDASDITDKSKRVLAYGSIGSGMDRSKYNSESESCALRGKTRLIRFAIS